MDIIRIQPNKFWVISTSITVNQKLGWRKLWPLFTSYIFPCYMYHRPAQILSYATMHACIPSLYYDFHSRFLYNCFSLLANVSRIKTFGTTFELWSGPSTNFKGLWLHVWRLRFPLTKRIGWLLSKFPFTDSFGCENVRIVAPKEINETPKFALVRSQNW